MLDNNCKSSLAKCISVSPRGTALHDLVKGECLRKRLFKLESLNPKSKCERALFLSCKDHQPMAKLLDVHYDVVGGRCTNLTPKKLSESEIPRDKSIS